MPPPETETPVTQELVAGARRYDLDGMNGEAPGVRPVKPGKSPHILKIVSGAPTHKNAYAAVHRG